MGQIPANYEENKQFLSVTNRSRYTVHAFSPCVVIAGESGGDNLLYVHSVIDRDIDADFQGQLYLLAISGPAEIPPGGSGRVSTDLPLIAQIQPTRTGDGIDDSEYQDFAYFFWNFQYNYLQPSPDGRGFQYLPTPVIPEDYPYSLGYWHWVDSLNSRFFEVAQFLDGEAEAMRKVRRGEPVLAYLREIGDHWYRGGYGWSSFTFWGAAGDAIEFEFGDFLTGSHFNRIPEDANLDDYRVVENPSENLQRISR